MPMKKDKRKDQKIKNTEKKTIRKGKGREY
jgi:hypothetical protein